MHLALVDNERISAAPNLKGLCTGCSQPVIAKCGTQRIWHWSHATKKVCDRWWETETEWHRQWKNNFPLEQQEVIKFDPVTGEKHIADVYTNHGLVIEFQHSALNPQERAAREAFYKNMLWIVDGTRLKRDFPRFEKGFQELYSSNIKGYFTTHFPDECFPSTWLNSSVPVIFDFLGATQDSQANELRDVLWCLLPGRAHRRAVVMGISRSEMVTVLKDRGQLMDAKQIVGTFGQYFQEEERKEATRHYSRSSNWFTGRGYRRNRRF